MRKALSCVLALFIALAASAHANGTSSPPTSPSVPLPVAATIPTPIATTLSLTSTSNQFVFAVGNNAYASLNCDIENLFAGGAALTSYSAIDAGNTLPWPISGQYSNGGTYGSIINNDGKYTFPINGSFLDLKVTTAGTGSASIYCLPSRTGGIQPALDGSGNQYFVIAGQTAPIVATVNTPPPAPESANGAVETTGCDATTVANCWSINSNGELAMRVGKTGSYAGVVTTPNDNISNSFTGLDTIAYLAVWSPTNGAWARGQIGPSNGILTEGGHNSIGSSQFVVGDNPANAACNNSVAGLMCGQTLTATTAVTTLVTGVSGKSIRPTAIYIGNSSGTQTTAQFYQGTNGSCATGLTAIGAPFVIASGREIQLSMGASSYFATSASNGLCVASSVSVSSLLVNATVAIY